jgi:myo-inositol-hexaphosphate 3-phosphohydrolase
MRLAAPTSSNPFQQQNPLSKPLYSPVRKPMSTTVGNVTVNTTKPVLLQTQQGDAPVTGDDLANKPGFWASKTKKQKTMIIISVVAGVSLLTYIALKKK